MKRIAWASCDKFDVQLTEADVKTKQCGVWVWVWEWVSSSVSANESLLVITQILKYLL
jgi:hypothetical protein